MAVVRLILRLSSSRPRPLAAVPALLHLVVGPCLNAHKRGAPTPEGVGRATRCTPSTASMGNQAWARFLSRFT